VGQVELPGPWQVAHDPHNRGGRRHWGAGSFTGQTVGLPNSLNPLPVTGAAGVRSFAGSVAWYRTAFTLVRPGRYAIRFESVNHRATVWLDGRRVVSHTGTYLPFEARFTTTAGVHTLVVKVDWRNPAAQSREGFHRTWFNFGGINRSVTIRPIGPSELLAPRLQTRLTHPGGATHAHVSVYVEIHNNLGARDLQVTGTLTHADQRVRFSFPKRHLAHGASAGLHVVVNLDSPALWQPGRPNLYDLDLAVERESGYHARVGLRQLTWSAGQLYLNGHHVVLHGASLQEDVRGHGDALTGADQDSIVAALRSLGANATRAQHPLDVGLLQRLDAAGILVWEGVGPVDPPGAWSAVTPRLRRNAELRVRTTVRQDEMHPSVVAWNLANEVAGNGHPGGEAHFIDHMARVLHRSDPGRLVAVDVWGDHPPKVTGSMYRHVDAVGVTNYEGWYSDTLDPQAVLARRIRAKLASLSKTFAGKVLIISEFGAEANGLNSRRKPGGYSFQARLVGLHLGLYRHLPSLSGMLVWDLRDFAVAPTFAGGSIRHTVPDIVLVKGLNQKGLYDYEQRPKPSVRVVQRAFRLMPLIG
jgi:hypothetical protein